MGISSHPPREFSLTSAGTKSPGQVSARNQFRTGRASQCRKEIHADGRQLRSRELRLVTVVRLQSRFARTFEKNRQLHQILIGKTVCRRKPPPASGADSPPQVPAASCAAPAPAVRTAPRMAPTAADIAPDFLPVRPREFLRPDKRTRPWISRAGCPAHNSPAPNTADCDRETNARAANRARPIPALPDRCPIARDD